jgi:CheY-like chemotaxis protein
VEDGRQTPGFGRAPVVAVTGRDLAPTLHRMFDAVVQKPVDAEQLCDVILAAVRRRHGSA